MAFNLHGFVMKTLEGMKINTDEYQVRQYALKWYSKGVLKDDKAILKARMDFEKECAKLGWLLKNTQKSSIKGKEGNVEYFYYYIKN